MRLRSKYNLPFIELIVENNSKLLHIPAVLVDTGSASTLLSMDFLRKFNCLIDLNKMIINFSLNE